MSTISSPAFSFRSDDKALHTLFPGINDDTEHTNSFEEYFRLELSEPSSPNDSHKDLRDQLSTFLDPAMVAHQGDHETPDTSDSKYHNKSPQPWRDGLWCIERKPPADLLIETPEKSSSPSILHSRYPNIKMPSSNANLSSGINRERRHNITRQMTLSPTPMYAQLPLRGLEDRNESWQEDLQNFHLESSHDGTMRGRSRVEDRTRYFMPTDVNRAAAAEHANIGVAITTDERSGISHHAYHGPFADTGMIDPRLLGHAYPDPTVRGYPGHHLYSSCGTKSVGSSSHSQGSHSDSSAGQLHESARYWTPTHGSASLSHGRHNFSRHYGNVVHPSSFPAPYPVWTDHHGQPGYGLGLHSSDVERLRYSGLPMAPQLPQAYHFPGYGLQTDVYERRPASSEELPSLPTPPLAHIDIGNSSKINVKSSSLELRRLSCSPPALASPVSRKRSSYQKDVSNSRGDTGPQGRRRVTQSRVATKDSEYLEPRARSRSQNPDRSRNRARSASRQRISKPSPSKAARVSTTNLEKIDFVNFTMHDSEKLLSDVAPSGSSKTRARREQEEKEKRRQLSEAAVRAVKKVGGDVSALKRMISAQ